MTSLCSSMSSATSGGTVTKCQRRRDTATTWLRIRTPGDPSAGAPPQLLLRTRPTNAVPAGDGQAGQVTVAVPSSSSLRSGSASDVCSNVPVNVTVAPSNERPSVVPPAVEIMEDHLSSPSCT